MALNHRQRLFVSEYLVDFNGTQAALRAGYSQTGAAEHAFRLLTNDEINAAIADKTAERLEVVELNVDWVLRQWKKIAEADPSELIWGELDCCRHCYGFEHAYQWTEQQFARAVAEARAHVCTHRCKEDCVKSLPPAAPGGFGYNPRLVPVLECPECHGRGVVTVCVADTRHVKGSARRLYAGIKQSKDGTIEIKMRDQDAALQNISRYFGMLIDRKEVSGPGGGPIPVAHLTADDLTDDQLAAVIFEESGGTIEGIRAPDDVKQLTTSEL